MPPFSGLAMAKGAGNRSSDGLWVAEPVAARASGGGGGRVFRADRSILASVLAGAPLESDPGDPVTVSIPLPDGKFLDFAVRETAVMAPGLAARFPEIKTYAGAEISDSGASVRLDLTPQGIHAMILDRAGGAVYLDPITLGDPERCVAYSKAEAIVPEDGWHCHSSRLIGSGVISTTKGSALREKPDRAAVARPSSGSELRTYRLAVAATGEYTAFHGGTVSLGMSAVVTAVNRVTGIFESELAVRLQLVPNNNLLIYTNSGTDPYTNSNGNALLGENQDNIDAIIGNANYDIGHVFSTDGGGLASLGSAGLDGSKARGETGSSNPTGDAYWVDFVSHEMGHQFGAEHTWNGDSDRCTEGAHAPFSAYEPGSGLTIMGYAGICGNDNVLSQGIPFFHFRSFDEITDHVDGEIPNVGVRTATGNTIPEIDAGSGFTIPARTPFVLTAIGSDADGDAITYSWEQRNLGPQQDINAGDNGLSPLFRTFEPTTDPSRSYPRLSDLLANATFIGETLPTTTRSLSFRVTARDNHLNGGGVRWADTAISVVDTGAPFRVTSPNTATTWPVGSIRTVSWDIAGTTANGINASAVDIVLSTDGGLTYPNVLAARVPNDGSELVTVPAVGATGAARVRVQASDGIFFDVSDANFTIAAGAAILLTASPPAQSICSSGTAVFAVETASFGGVSGPVTLSANGLPSGASATFSPNPVPVGDTATLVVSGTGAAPAGTSAIIVHADAPGGVSGEVPAVLTISLGVPAVPSLMAPAPGAGGISTMPTFSWAASNGAAFYDIEISDDGMSFTNPISSTTTLLTTNIFALQPSTTYHWRVRASNVCGSQVSPSRVFTTTDLFQQACSTPNAPIPDVTFDGVEDELVVLEDGRISDLDLSVNLTHTYVGDLEVVLTHLDTGTSIGLIIGLGARNCQGDDIEIILDDEAAIGVEAGCSNSNPAFPRGGRFQPESPLAAFDGENIGGTWILNVVDLQAADTGSLIEWCLLPSFNPVLSPFEQWRRANFDEIQLANLAFSGPSADPDQDGRQNLLEYFFGCAPLIPDVLHGATALRSNPAGIPTALRYSRSMLRYDAVDIPEFSTDLGGWALLPRTIVSPGSAIQTFESPIPEMPGFTRLGVDLRD